MQLIMNKSWVICSLSRSLTMRCATSDMQTANHLTGVFRSHHQFVTQTTTKQHGVGKKNKKKSVWMVSKYLNKKRSCKNSTKTKSRDKSAYVRLDLNCLGCKFVYCIYCIFICSQYSLVHIYIKWRHGSSFRLFQVILI